MRKSNISINGRKNDNCNVEQKKFDAVSKLVGYARNSSPEVIGFMNKFYHIKGLLQNYIYPSFKLISKKRVGSRFKKVYVIPKSPARIILDCKDIDENVKEGIRHTLATIKPIFLAHEVKNLQAMVFSLADKVLVNPYPDEIAS